jgi:hypothetical protein
VSKHQRIIQPYTSTMPIILMSFLASMSLGGSALAEMAPGALPEQFTQNCQTSNPRLERLASAIKGGEIHYVRTALDEGVDVNETWRDLPSQVCLSLLLRSIWYSQDEIFGLLLKRGADPRSLPRESLGIPVRNGRVDMVRTLLALGLKPHDNDAIVRDGLESHNVAMLDLLASSGVTIDASRVPSWALTDDLTPHLVPKYLRPNDSTNVGNEACTVQAIFGLLSPEQDGCEGTQGPLWLHFVVTGNIRMMELMIKNGANLSLSAEVWDNSKMRPFNAMDVAVRRKDKRMADLLRRAGAPPGIWGRKRVIGVRTGLARLLPHGREELPVTFENPFFRLLIRLQRRHAALLRAAEQDTVAPRKHVEAVARQRDVIDLGLRQQNCELPLDRSQLFIPEQRSRAQAGAIEHDRLLHRHEIAARREVADDYPPACDEKLA